MVKEALKIRPSLAREEALKRARALGDVVAAYAEEAEQLRRIPPAVVKAVMESGLMPLVRAPYWGGYGLDWMAFTDCLCEIGRSSGSIAWCVGFLFHHQWVLGHFPQGGQALVFQTDADPKIATSFAVSGQAERTNGGYRVTGEWAFASGCDHCDWAIVGATFPGAGPRFVLLKPGQYSIRDTWHSVGLKGSGSNNIVVKDALVAEECTLELGAFYSGYSPGSTFLDGPLYQTTPAAQFQFGLLVPMLAIARGAHESSLEFNRNRVTGIVGGRASEDPFVQARLGESSAEISTAYALLDRINQGIISGHCRTPAEAAEVGRDFAMIGRLLVKSVDRLFEISGARGLAESNPVGRHWRDVHAITHHVALNIDGMFQAYGRQLFAAGAKS